MNSKLGGWVKIQNQAAIAAIREAKLPIDGLVQSTGHPIYVPRWVHDAVDLYQQTYGNTDISMSNGYADLTLVEFLKKINPTQSK